MPEFPHLQLLRRIDGLFKSHGGSDNVINPITKDNLEHRDSHGKRLLTNIDHLSEYWANNIKSRSEQQLPDLPDSNTIPVFLQIDPKEFDIESLKSIGIEIIAEEVDGFIIGAAADNFVSLKEKIEIFLKNEEGKKFQNKAAQLWQINEEGTQWKIDLILSDDLKAKWDQIGDADQFVVDIGIACYQRISNQPEKKEDISKEVYLKALNKWRIKKDLCEKHRDEIALKRQTEFEEFIHACGGSLLGSYIDFIDSFACRIRISGKGLKDLVLNYQYIFEVIEHDPLSITDISAGEIDGIEPELIPPGENFPKVCVIDSGIQQEHRLLAPSIDSATSISFIPDDSSVADVMGNGGHGTRVAGAVLYPNNIPRNGQYQLPCFIQNARILSPVGGSASLPENLFPPMLMVNIINHFENTRLFNMSVNSYSPCKTIHMSQLDIPRKVDHLFRSKLGHQN